VSLVIAILIVVVAAAVAVAAMLLVRRHAPEGSYFNDGDRAAGVFGVLATGFAVLLGFVVFLAFTSYDSARSGAETEALIVSQQIQTAQFLPESVSGELTEELVCYARSVAGVQWERMREGTLGEQINPFAAAMFHTIRDVEPATVSEQSAYDRWMDQTVEREQARSARIHGAVGVIPVTLWVVLFFTAALIFVFMLFFADSGERAVVQGMLIGSVVSVLAATMLLLGALNDPFRSGVGGLQPVAMERTLQIIDEELVVAGVDIDPPCDAEGNAV
jgi:hypothetical protein